MSVKGWEGGITLRAWDIQLDLRQKKKSQDVNCTGQSKSGVTASWFNIRCEPLLLWAIIRHAKQAPAINAAHVPQGQRADGSKAQLPG